jgi:two-component system sensor histidine kinase BaeS
MFRSLRFQLPALFFAGVIVFALVAAAISFQLLQSYTIGRARADLRREAAGLTRLYAAQATGSNDPIPARQLETATGDRIFYVPVDPGVDLFPDKKGPRLRQLPKRLIDFTAVTKGRTLQFDFTLPGTDKTWLGVAQPLQLGRNGRSVFYGALLVAKPKDQLATRVVPLLGRIALALLGGLAVAVILGVFISRRLTRPVLKLARAADEVARGNYDVAVPSVRGGNEVSLLSNRFAVMARRLGEAEQLERNFLMSVSHELRTPLTAIRGHVAALSEGLVEDEEARGVSLEIVAEETERLSRLVNDVLDLAKLDARRFTVLQEEVDMEHLVERAYTTFNEEARRRGIDYRSELRAQPVLITDGDRVLQIITNLLSNAFRWTPDGGRIELGLGQENGNIAVSVADTGPGITPEERERIFRPFWSRDGRGTGLGLAIANELAQALGGRIELETEVGEGSTFELVLPTN